MNIVIYNMINLFTLFFALIYCQSLTGDNLLVNLL